MTEPVNADLYRRAVELLRPGDIELEGAVVHTSLADEEESLMHQLTLDAGDVVADHVTDGETYVYSGNDDADFGVNQHHGRTVDGDEFVWECQQLMREGTYDVVLYWEATDEHDAILANLRDVENAESVVGVTEDGYVAE